MKRGAIQGRYKYVRKYTQMNANIFIPGYFFKRTSVAWMKRSGIQGRDISSREKRK
jgi:hypothetical protein